MKLISIVFSVITSCAAILIFGSYGITRACLRLHLDPAWLMVPAMLFAISAGACLLALYLVSTGMVK